MKGDRPITKQGCSVCYGCSSKHHFFLRANVTVIFHAGIVPKYCVQQAERLSWGVAHMAKYITAPAGNNTLYPCRKPWLNQLGVTHCDAFRTSFNIETCTVINECSLKSDGFLCSLGGHAAPVVTVDRNHCNNKRIIVALLPRSSA